MTLKSWTLLILIASVALRASADAQTLNAGDRIEAYDTRDFTWHKATIVKIGSGEMQGRYLVHFDGTADSWNQWLEPKRLRAASATAASQSQAVPAPRSAPPAASDKVPARASSSVSAGGPRLGKYSIFSYGAPTNPPIYLGHVELLAGGKYRASRTSGGEYYGSGDYRFDASSASVQWTSGPFRENSWTGQFTAERDGKTHKIRLARTTVATNSLD